MNLLNTIIRTHFACAGHEEIYHSIKIDIGAWGRGAINLSKPKFHFLEPIVVQSYTARVLALFYTAMWRKRYLTDVSDISLKRPENFDAIIETFNFTIYF
jgi:hypothetical protein